MSAAITTSDRYRLNSIIMSSQDDDDEYEYEDTYVLLEFPALENSVFLETSKKYSISVCTRW